MCSSMGSRASFHAPDAFPRSFVRARFSWTPWPPRRVSRPAVHSRSVRVPAVTVVVVVLFPPPTGALFASRRTAAFGGPLRYDAAVSVLADRMTDDRQVDLAVMACSSRNQHLGKALRHPRDCVMSPAPHRREQLTAVPPRSAASFASAPFSGGGHASTTPASNRVSLPLELLFARRTTRWRLLACPG